MTRSGKLLAVAGMALAVWAMSYGFYYAVWVEHQTLDHVGGSLATSFMEAARGDMNASRAQIDEYARAKFNYVREVDAHSHWIGLATVLLLLSALWDRLSFSEKMRSALAWMLIAGAVLFPLAVLLQKYIAGQFAQALAILGTGLLLAGFGMVAVGFVRERARLNIQDTDQRSR
jgi:hypothetical protein